MIRSTANGEVERSEAERDEAGVEKGEAVHHAGDRNRGAAQEMKKWVQLREGRGRGAINLVKGQDGALRLGQNGTLDGARDARQDRVRMRQDCEEGKKGARKRNGR